MCLQVKVYKIIKYESASYKHRLNNCYTNMSMYEFMCQFVRGTTNVQTPRGWGGSKNVEPNVTNVEGVGGVKIFSTIYIYIIELNFELGHNKYINYSPKYQMVRPYMFGQLWHKVEIGHTSVGGGAYNQLETVQMQSTNARVLCFVCFGLLIGSIDQFHLPWHEQSTLTKH